MALPVIVGTTSGGSITSNTYGFTPTLPSGNVGDLLICIVSVGRNHAVATVHTIPVYWYQMYYTPDVYHDCTTSIFLKYATNTSEDTCYFETHYLRNAAGVDQVTSTPMYTKPSWICYRISGGYIPMGRVYGNTIFSMIHGGTEYVHSSGDGANWDLPICPSVTFEWTEQKDNLWICAVASRLGNVATVAPAGFSDLITRAGTALVKDSSSISTCTYFSSVVKEIDPGAFTSPNDTWVGFIIRIQDDIDFDPDPPIPGTSIGVGTWLNYKESYVYEPITDSVVLTPSATQDYYSDGSAYTDNDFQTYIEVISSGAWTAAWLTGTNFTAEAYSGIEGVTYIAITCNGENTSGLAYTDTFTVTSGAASDAVSVTQDTT